MAAFIQMLAVAAYPGSPPGEARLFFKNKVRHLPSMNVLFKPACPKGDQDMAVAARWRRRNATWRSRPALTDTKGRHA